MLVPPTCSCSLSSFGCGPAGRVVAGYVGVVGDENLKLLALKGPGCGEPPSFGWRQGFVSVVSYVEDCAGRWARCAKEELGAL